MDTRLFQLMVDHICRMCMIFAKININDLFLCKRLLRDLLRSSISWHCRYFRSLSVLKRN